MLKKPMEQQIIDNPEKQAPLATKHRT